MKATVIVDNISSGGAKGEWGLSIHIEYDGKNYLLDAGATNLFEKNAAYLGLDLKAVDAAVLSHAHYDHSGGLERFLCLNEKAPLYLQQPVPCYFKKFFFRKYIGLPRSIQKHHGERLSCLNGDHTIALGVHLIAHHTPGLEAVGKREMMYIKTSSGWRADAFSHEQSLVFETEGGLVIFNSCSHGGVGTIIDEVRAAFPGTPVIGYAGGFHLFNKSDEEVRKVGDAIKRSGLSYIATGHCTKDRAYKILKEELGPSLHQMHVGMVMEFSESPEIHTLN